MTFHDSVSQFIPGIDFGSIFGAVAILLILGVVAVIAIGGGIFLIQKRKYNKQRSKKWIYKK